MNTQTILKILKNHQEPFKGNDLEEMSEDNSESLFIKFKGSDDYIEIVVNSSTSFETLETDSGVVRIEEVYIQESVDHVNVFFINSDSIRSISTIDY